MISSIVEKARMEATHDLLSASKMNLYSSDSARRAFVAKMTNTFDGMVDEMDEAVRETGKKVAALAHKYVVEDTGTSLPLSPKRLEAAMTRLTPDGGAGTALGDALSKWTGQGSGAARDVWRLGRRRVESSALRKEFRRRLRDFAADSTGRPTAAGRMVDEASYSNAFQNDEPNWSGGLL